MNPWYCAFLIAGAGGLGGVVNALITGNGFAFPKREAGVWCPGFISNVLIGAFAAVSSWSFYGSGASIDLAHETERAVLSLKFSALAGALLVGVGGARWISNEADKLLLKEGVKVAAQKTTLTAADCEQIIKGPARDVLKALQSA